MLAVNGCEGLCSACRAQAIVEAQTVARVLRNNYYRVKL